MTTTVQQNLGSHCGSRLMASLRVMGFLGLIVALTPVHVIYGICKPQEPFRISLLFHGLLIRLLGFQIRMHGLMATRPPIMFVANHSSYLDIPVLGALIPAAFVAKADVARWPLFGTLAKLQHTVFIERRPTRTRDQRDGIRQRFEDGQNLVLFPEGTSSDGLRVLPFKSGLFSAIAEMPVTIQPVSIVCTELDGLPITRAWRPYYAWFGDMTLIGHLWTVFKIGRFTVDVVFHPTVSPEAFPDRKALAAYCQQQVAHGIELCLTGRHLHTDAVKLPGTPKPSLAGAP